MLYAATWEVAYFKFIPDFADKYAAYSIEKAKASGASQKAMEKKTCGAEQFRQSWKKPAVNVR